MKKTGFDGCKSQIFFIGDQNSECGDKIVEAWRFRERRRDGLAGLGGHSAYQEAPEVIFYGGPAGCTPFLSESIFSCLLKSNLI